MCRGNIREIEEGVCANGTSSQGTMCCALCDSDAFVYCQADDAFLCRKCDKNVHEANFLAKRHIRCLLCRTCQNLTNRYLIGVSVQVVLPSIVSINERGQCNSEDDDDDDNNDDEYSQELIKRPFLFL